MIRVVTGTPGSGKSCYAVLEIAAALEAGKCVATNIALADDFPERVARRHPRAVLWPRYRRKLAESYRSRVVVLSDSADIRRIYPEDRREGQTLCVIDEAHALLDSRDIRAQDRQDWIVWLTQHRKLGLDVLFLVQHFEMLDTNLRRLTEWEIRLRDLRRARVYGLPIPFPATVGHWFWISMKKPQRTQLFRPARAHGLFDTKATLHGITGARPADAIDLPALPSTARQGLEGEPEREALAIAPRESPVNGPLAANRAQATDTPGNTERAEDATSTRSRDGALPAPLDAQR